jgi:exodeoxyribonuclease-5
VFKRSEDQEQAYRKFLQWMASGASQEFRLGGLAGTGKTTLVKAMQEQMSNCDVIAPTAKAAEVLNRKGVAASTCHSLLCRFEHEEQGADGKLKPVFSDKKVTKDFIIVDESSMITSEMRRKILRCANRVVWVGDYGQLPPVDPDGTGESVMSEESLDAKLTTQHRHTGSADLIDFANFLRAGNHPRKWKSVSEQVYVDPAGVQTFNDVVDYVLNNKLWPVICYRNAFISGFNHRVRHVLGFKKQIEIGLRIVCTYNSYQHGIANGEMFTVAKFDGSKITTECGKRFPVTFDPAERSSVRVQDGYAVTCHKSQGSEWPQIAVIEDIAASPQWRYTAATRAQKHVTYITNDDEV